MQTTSTANAVVAQHDTFSKPSGCAWRLDEAIPMLRHIPAPLPKGATRPGCGSAYERRNGWPWTEFMNADCRAALASIIPPRMPKSRKTPPAGKAITDGRVAGDAPACGQRALQPETPQRTAAHRTNRLIAVRINEHAIAVRAISPHRTPRFIPIRFTDRHDTKCSAPPNAAIRRIAHRSTEHGSTLHITDRDNADRDDAPNMPIRATSPHRTRQTVALHRTVRSKPKHHTDRRKSGHYTASHRPRHFTSHHHRPQALPWPASSQSRPDRRRPSSRR